MTTIFSIRLPLAWATVLLVYISALGQASRARAEQFPAVDAIFKKEIADGKIPGAVVIVGRRGRVVYRRAFGYRSLEPTRELMTVDTIFDLASLTKPIATATAVMRLVQHGQVRLNDPVVQYIPEFDKLGKDQITIRQLLTHYSGLREDLDLDVPWWGYAEAMRRVWEEKPIYPPGWRFLYSDINYLVLGELVLRVSGMPLDKYAEAHIFRPLNMTRTRFNPPASWRTRIAPTEYAEGGRMLRGVVHDPTARRMGGVAGHAGLFGTADDVAKFAQAILDQRILTPALIRKMTTPQQPANATVLRGLGWDIDSPFSSTRGELLPVGSFGHTGFTGTSLWIDPLTKTYIVVLANGVHPRAGEPVVSLRGRVANAVAATLKLSVSEQDKIELARLTGYNEASPAARRVPFRNGTVLNGIDVLVRSNFAELQAPDGKRRKIGLVTNHTGVDAQGRRTIDLLAQAPGVELAAIFSPEHGVTGALDTTQIGNAVDAATGIPVYTVYGDTDAKRRPDPEVVKTLEALVYDIQDVGVRFYTYETTLGYFLEAAAQARIPIYVLDRPNPITGAFVQGPLSEATLQSFVNYHNVPVRHGLTIGELARMFNAERGINAKLTVIKMDGWMRGDWFDATGQSWVSPSPNMRSLTQATLYPGVALIEGTNVSVGRGTDTPFEVLGAPWINGRELASYLNARSPTGVRFVPISFTPKSSKYANQLCGGVNIVLLDRMTLDAPQLGIELASALRTLYPQQFEIDKMTLLLANKRVFDSILAGVDPRRIVEDWREPLQAFSEMRKKYLLY
jgi:uncharacterized protein YbbC (DUF1343 family)/CubicO group peptidase (beta-lactamase class C family)